MERRTFITTTGTGIGIGVAGCLDSDSGTEDETGGNGNEDETVSLDDDSGSGDPSDTDSNAGDTGGGGDETGSETDGTEDATNDPESDTDEETESASATFEVTSIATNSPIGGGELLVVEATIENVGDESGTADVDLVVGHDPEIEDSETLTLEAGETADLTLEFQAGDPAGDSEEFPVSVNTGAHEISETVVVGDADDDPDEGVTFESCERVTITGSFEDGDVAYASTSFYDEAGVGNTIIEDGITVGEDVAPFSGTIVFEIADEQAVTEGDNGVVVSVPDYGVYGTAITGLTTDPDDYAIAGTTHSNPHAEDCLEEIESEWADATGGSS